MAIHALTTRREALKAVPVAAAATMFPVVALGGPRDPHPAWLTEWQRLGATINDASICDEEAAPHFEVWMDLGRRIEETSAWTPAGLAAQIVYGIGSEESLYIDVPRALLERMLTSLRALA